MPEGFQVLWHRRHCMDSSSRYHPITRTPRAGGPGVGRQNDGYLLELSPREEYYKFNFLKIELGMERMINMISAQIGGT